MWVQQANTCCTFFILSVAIKHLPIFMLIFAENTQISL